MPKISRKIEQKTHTHSKLIRIYRIPMGQYHILEGNEQGTKILRNYVLFQNSMHSFKSVDECLSKYSSQIPSAWVTLLESSGTIKIWTTVGRNWVNGIELSQASLCFLTDRKWATSSLLPFDHNVLLCYRLKGMEKKHTETEMSETMSQNKPFFFIQ